MKKPFLIISIITVFLACCIYIGAVYFYPAWSYTHDEPGSFIYTDYGVYVPTGHSMYGIDVSRYQGNINWKEVADMEVQDISLDFVFIKATEGLNMVDKKFQQNWKQAKKHKIHRGAYHYYLPHADPVQQAKNFISQVKLLPGDLPPVIDIEDRGENNSDKFIADIRVFLKTIEDHYGCKPIVYSYDSFHQDHIIDELTDYPLWIARYGPEKPGVTHWKFWQFTDKARVNGIEQEVDMNVFAGDSLAFQQLLYR